VRTLIFGHQPFPEVHSSPFAMGIDTGCAMGGKLSGLVLEAGQQAREGTVVSVPATKAWTPWSRVTEE